jgi:hypothetical protein
MGRFSTVAGKTVRGGVAAVHQGAGRGWRCIVRAMPCRLGCGATRVRTRVCWNATHALGAPSSQFGSGWHGQGAVHGRSGAWAPSGIERWGDGEASGEVTARGGFDGVLTKRGIHGGNGDAHGTGGVARPVSAAWGRAAHAHWGLAGGGGVKEN